MLLGVCMRGFSRCVCVCFLVWLSGAYNKESSLSKDYHLHQNSDIHHCQLVISWQVQNFENDFSKDYRSLSDQ